MHQHLNIINIENRDKSKEKNKMRKQLKKIAAALTATGLLFSLAGCGGGSTATPTTSVSANTTEAASESQGIVAGKSGSSTMNTGLLVPTADTRVIQLGHCNPSNDQDQYTYFGRQLNDHLMELSDGKFGIEVVGDSQLGGERDLFEGLSMGTVDAAIITNLAFTSSIPQTAALELPFLYDDEEQGYTTFNDPEILGYLQEIFYNDWNIHASNYIESGFRKSMLATKEYQNIDSFKGLKIRVPESPIYLDVFNAIGASPTTMAFSECYTAIQQGVVDGLEIPVSGIYSAKYYEICKSMVETNHIYVAGAICFSRSFWDSLSEEEQKWFDEAAKLAGEDEKTFVRSTEQQKIEEMGKVCNIIQPSEEDVQAFRDAMAPVYEKYKATIGEEFYNKVMTHLGRQ